MVHQRLTAKTTSFRNAPATTIAGSSTSQSVRWMLNTMRECVRLNGLPNEMSNPLRGGSINHMNNSMRGGFGGPSMPTAFSGPMGAPLGAPLGNLLSGFLDAGEKRRREESVDDRNDNAILHAKIQLLQQEVTELRANKGGVSEECENLHRRVTSLQKEVMELRSTVDSLYEQNSKYRAKYGAGEQAINQQGTSVW